MLRGFLTALAILRGTIRDCSPDGSLATIQSMGIDPVTPKAGDNSTIWVAYDLPTEVTGGTVTYTYSLNYIPFQPTTVDLCVQEACPLAAGSHNASGSSSFPDVSGRLEGKIEWHDQSGTPIWCVDTVYSV
jgi:hypothetical protein